MGFGRAQLYLNPVADLIIQARNRYLQELGLQGIDVMPYPFATHLIRTAK